MSVPSLGAEAAAAVAEIRPSVEHAAVLPHAETDDGAPGGLKETIQVRTAEQLDVTFELTARGYRVASTRARPSEAGASQAGGCGGIGTPGSSDSVGGAVAAGSEWTGCTFETLTSALDSMSPGYRSKFGQTLFAKLSALSDTS